MQLNSLRKNGQFCDVILISCDGKQFPAHKTVLAAGCVYFNVLFSVNMAEKQQTRVHLKAVPSSALNEILEYIYTGVLRVTKSCVVEMIFTSSMFLLFDVTEYCWSIFVNTLDLENCIARKIFSDNVGSTTIAETVTKYVLSNFVNIVSDSLALCPVSILRELFSSEELIVNNELEVLVVFLKWFGNQNFERSSDRISEQEMKVSIKTVCEELLSLVRFTFITLDREEFVGFLHNFGISEYSWLWEMILKGMESNSGSKKARISYGNVDVLVVVGGQGESDVLNQVSVYIPSIDQWCQIAALNHPRRRFVLYHVIMDISCFAPSLSLCGTCFDVNITRAMPLFLHLLR